MIDLRELSILLVYPLEQKDRFRRSLRPFCDDPNAAPIFDGVKIQTSSSGTPQRRATTANHLDPIHKLALGWVTPRTAVAAGTATLEDVRNAREVIRLPRRRAHSIDECYALELRTSESSDKYYDSPLDGTGIAVGHSVTRAAGGDQPPVCISQADWDSWTEGHPGRQGIRLIRPSIERNVGDPLWTNQSYDLDDQGLICPGAGHGSGRAWRRS